MDEGKGKRCCSEYGVDVCCHAYRGKRRVRRGSPSGEGSFLRTWRGGLTFGHPSTGLRPSLAKDRLRDERYDSTSEVAKPAFNQQRRLPSHHLPYPLPHPPLPLPPFFLLAGHSPPRLALPLLAHRSDHRVLNQLNSGRSPEPTLPHFPHPTP